MVPPALNRSEYKYRVVLGGNNCSKYFFGRGGNIWYEIFFNGNNCSKFCFDIAVCSCCVLHLREMEIVGRESCFRISLLNHCLEMFSLNETLLEQIKYWDFSSEFNKLPERRKYHMCRSYCSHLKVGVFQNLGRLLSNYPFVLRTFIVSRWQ